jgi:hypothetical protein
LGLGPTVVALITDFGFHDPMMLRYSLAIAVPSALILAASAVSLGSSPRVICDS